MSSMDSRVIPPSMCWIAFLCAGLAAAAGAAPFDTATVTRVENKATVTEIRGAQATGTHPATVSEVIRANHFLQTASDARAELEFLDKSLLRVGPNTVFSFDARTRTLSLEKGDMLFYLPPGRGGVKIKTAALTAALTGTVVLVSKAGIVALDGTVTLTYLENGEEKKTVIQAGTDHNAAKWENGKLVTYKSTGTDSLWSTARKKLLTWAALPADAEKKIAQHSPWLKQAAADYAVISLSDDAVISLFDNAAVGFDSDISRLANRALVTTSNTVTAVLPNGSVGIFDSIGRFLGLR